MDKAHGFDDEKQGNLFWEISRIVKDKRPSIVFLENVKNLKSHDKGNTWDTIYKTLSEELNYKVFEKVIDSRMWVPQHRERIFIVAFNKEKYSYDIEFEFPKEPLTPKHNGIQSILDDDVLIHSVNAECLKLGFGSPIFISGEHGHGLSDLYIDMLQELEHDDLNVLITHGMCGKLADRRLG